MDKRLDELLLFMLQKCTLKYALSSISCFSFPALFRVLGKERNTFLFWLGGRISSSSGADRPSPPPQTPQREKEKRVEIRGKLGT